MYTPHIQLQGVTLDTLATQDLPRPSQVTCSRNVAVESIAQKLSGLEERKQRTSREALDLWLVLVGRWIQEHVYTAGGEALLFTCYNVLVDRATTKTERHQGQAFTTKTLSQKNMFHHISPNITQQVAILSSSSWCNDQGLPPRLTPPGLAPLRLRPSRSRGLDWSGMECRMV